MRIKDNVTLYTRRGLKIEKILIFKGKSIREY
jgi:hypothetical protein